MSNPCEHIKVWSPIEGVQWCTSCGAIRLPELDDAWTLTHWFDDPSATMDTISGRRISLLAPRPEDVDIGDIGHQISMQNRFNGAIKFAYNVGEHSTNVAVSTYFLHGGTGEPLRDGFVLPPDADPRTFWGAVLRALVHDGSEGYIGDCIRPLKRLLPTYQRIEALHMRAIHTALGFGPDEDWAEIDESVDKMDKQAYAVEHHVLRGGPPAQLRGVEVLGWDWETSRKIFLGMAQQLMICFEPYRVPPNPEIVASYG